MRFPCFAIPVAAVTIAALRGFSGAEPPKDQPAYVPRATPEESAADFFDRMYQWERAWDAHAFPGLPGLRPGPWYKCGPVKIGSPEYRELRRSYSAENLEKPVRCDGKTLTWEEAPEIAYGKVQAFDCRPGEAWFFAHPIEMLPDVKGRDDYILDLMIDDEGSPHVARHGSGTVDLGPDSRTSRFPCTFDRSVWSFQPVGVGKKLTYTLEVRGNPFTGKARFYFDLRQRSDARAQTFPPGNTYVRGIRVIDAIAAGAAKCFPSEFDREIVSWANTDQLWGSRDKRLRFPHELRDEFLDSRMRHGVRAEAARLEALFGATQGVEVAYLAPYRASCSGFAAYATNLMYRVKGAEAIALYRRTCALERALRTALSIDTSADAVRDLAATFGAEYPKRDAYLAALADLKKGLPATLAALVKGESSAAERAVAAYLKIGRARDRILLDNPLIRRHPLVMVRGKVNFAPNWYPSNGIGQELLLYDLSGDGPKETVLRSGQFSDYDIHWDAERILYADRVNVFEMPLADTNAVRQITRAEKGVTHYDACYLPNGKIISACNACWQTVPCVGAWDVGNLHLFDADGSNERRITFDQDHDWNPCVMEDGRVMFSRWEYADTPHYFTRLIMRMNPDGTGQMEFYGSNSYWPNATYWPMQIPGSPNRFVAIVSGHHGVNRAGYPVLFDVTEGRRETSGVVQRFPGRGKTVENVIEDGLVNDEWPKYAAAFPLAEGPENKGAGKYFLASRQTDAQSGWDLVLLDAFDNVTTIRPWEKAPDGEKIGYMTGRTLMKRPVPRVIPDKVDPAETNATLYLVNLYVGDGLKNFPEGSVKALRVCTFNYRYFGNGSTFTCAYEGGWDCRKVLGTVPVHPDGSALFRVPANMPVYVQPLDAEGKAQAVMRSWYSAMPGEVGSCVGCHESQNSASPAQMRTIAARAAPSEIASWNGKPPRMFDFEADVQPLLNRKCVGCHDDGEKEKATGHPDFRDKRIRPERQDEIPNWVSIGKVPGNPGWLAGQNRHLKEDGKFFSPAYMRLQRYVRRPGLEADYHLLPPAEFEADTSYLVKMLKKGHHGVELAKADWDVLYTWIDLNVPYYGRWTDCPLPPNPEHVAKRKKYAKLYWNRDEVDEDPIPVPPVAKFEPPARKAPPPAPSAMDKALTVMPADFQPEGFEIATPQGTRIPFQKIPAGSFTAGSGLYADEPLRTVTVAKPFALMKYEVSNALFAEFDPEHDSRYMDARNKDRVSRGYPVNQPESCVIRVTRREAEAFCRWLTGKTGRKCSLPTEVEWEWACRAGLPPENRGYTKFGPPCANLCGAETSAYNFGASGRGGLFHGYCMRDWNDGRMFNCSSASGLPNAWGLCNMIGNVAEWTASDWTPGDARKVVKGGSWNDVLKFAAPYSRWRYEEYKPVYDVGFRVKVEE